MILHGRETAPGATIFQVFSTMIANVLAPVFSKVEVEVDPSACHRRIVVPCVIDSVSMPTARPFTDQDHRVRVTLRDGSEYLEAEYGRARDVLGQGECGNRVSF